MKRITIAAITLAIASPLAGCMHSVHLDPIQVEPVQVTMDVNVHIEDERDDADDAEEGDVRDESARADG